MVFIVKLNEKIRTVIIANSCSGYLVDRASALDLHTLYLSCRAKYVRV